MHEITIIIPVVRPQNIPSLIKTIYKNSGISNEFYGIIWLEDKEGIGAPKMVKKLTSMAQTDLVMFLGDDTIPQEGFLKNSFDCMKTLGYGLVGLNDYHGQKATHWLASKKLLPFLGGEFFHTGYIHNFCDDELRILCERLGRYRWCAEARIEHRHPSFGTGQMDEHYEKVLNRANWEHDKRLFEERLRR